MGLLGAYRVAPYRALNKGDGQMKDRSHDEAMVEQFHADPAYAAELLTEVRRNCDSAELAILSRQMAKAFGQDMAHFMVFMDFNLVSD
jgi:hypothetical protein